MFFAIELNSTEIVIELILFVVDCLLLFSQTDCAFALLQQLTQFCEYISTDKPRIKIYIKMADICTRIKEYERAAKILHKTIELCWIFKDYKTELRVYDLIGYNYYMLGLVNIAIFNHEK